MEMPAYMNGQEFMEMPAYMNGQEFVEMPPYMNGQNIFMNLQNNPYMPNQQVQGLQTFGGPAQFEQYEQVPIDAPRFMRTPEPRMEGPFAPPQQPLKPEHYQPQVASLNSNAISQGRRVPYHWVPTVKETMLLSGELSIVGVIDYNGSKIDEKIKEYPAHALVEVCIYVHT
jgi:hypothetical protein